MKKSFKDCITPGVYNNPVLFEKIDSLDLDFIRDRMLIKYKWKEQRVDDAILGYKQYLYMTQVLNSPISPGGDVDEIWHQHILHTNKYGDDCMRVLGRFLHHIPTPVSVDLNEVLSAATCNCDALCESDGNCAAETGSCENNDPRFATEVGVSAKKKPLSFREALSKVFV